MVLGLISLLAVVVALLYPRLRRVELELPDVIGDTAPVAAGG
jgi:hypothetical protein